MQTKQGKTPAALRQWNQAAPPLGSTANFKEGFGNRLFAARTQNLAVKWTSKCLINNILTCIGRFDFSKRAIYAG
jgi:hypothetical protein